MKSLFALFLLLTVPAMAGLKTEAVTYQSGGVPCEGWLAFDEATAGKRPGVLVVHQWRGLSDYEKKRAEMLARLGYNVFALDIYGKGVRPVDRKEAGEQAGKFKGNRALYRERLNAGLEVLRKHPLTDARRVAAIGYCFGGTGVLELAREGADVAGVVSFHGGLGAGNVESRPIRCRVLALHGADDPFVKAEEVAGFEQEMRAARADWQLVAYGGAVHSFTDRSAGSDNSAGAAYNEKADRRSWEAMKVFFNEIFADR